MSSTSPTTTGAKPALTTIDSNRIFSLDVLRGVAVLGILIISIWEFGGFIANEQTFYRQGTHSGGNYKLLTVVSILFEGKMRALFALLFGAGIILFLQKKDHPSTASTADLYIRRNMWLIFFGVFNAFVLLWPGDILFHLGILGILLFAFQRMSSRGLLIAAIICTLIYCGKNYWNYADDKKAYGKYKAVLKVEEQFKKDSTDKAKTDSIAKAKDSIAGKAITPVITDTTSKKIGKDSTDKKKDTLTKKQAGEKSAWEGMAKRAKYDSTATENEYKSMRASYGKLWNYLMGRSQGKEASWFYRLGIWDLASMMFLGMALLGWGFFTNRFSAQKYLLIAVLTMALGFFLAWLRVDLLNTKIVDYAKYIDKKPIPFNQFVPIERFLLATGYASLIMLLLRTKFLNWLWQALAAVGRLAFTNYIMQSLICTFFFYGYGFGFFGRLSQLELYLFVIEIWVIQTVFSIFWLRYYSMGPLEWLWRCLVYRKWLPIKLKQDETAIA
ncbi:MAG TPA: DUF418 domain-containing protein [Chitinophagaceae bacterium]